MNTSTIMYAMDGDDSTIYEEDIKVLGRGCVRPKREVGGGQPFPELRTDPPSFCLYLAGCRDGIATWPQT